MNMLSSLKAMLLSSAPLPGAAAIPATGQDTADFAAMLNGSLGDAIPADPAAAPTVLPLDMDAPAPADAELPLAVDQLTQPAAHEHVPPGLAVAVAAGKGAPSALPPGLALGLIRHRAESPPAPPEGEPTEVTSDVVPVADPAPSQPQPQPQPQSQLPTGEIKLSAKPQQTRHKKDAAPETLPSIPGAELKAEAQPKTETQPEGEVQPKGHREAEAEIVATALPVVDPTVPSLVAVVNTAAEPAPVANKAEQGDGEKPSAAPLAVAPTTSSPPVVAPAAPHVVAAQPPEHRPGPEAVEQAAPPPKSVVAKQEDAASEEKPLLSTDKQDVSAPILNGKPVKAEALALLQLVREQVSARQSGAPVRVGEQVSATASAKAKPSGPEAERGLAPSVPQLPVDATPPVTGASPQSVTVQAPVAAPPVVDLSASLGAQMVDMGVSGQWIDGLARDIAGLSANGAQGRFQIDTAHLGAVQVDVRQGSEGAAVSLTVASEAAEVALRQDSDRLKLDAGLAAVRISEVRVERASPVAEAQRPEMGNQSSSQQQQPQQQGSQTASAWQQNNQNMAQSQSQQNRWQGRENNAFGAKGSADPAVLNHADAQPRAQDAVRARYA